MDFIVRQFGRCGPSTGNLTDMVTPPSEGEIKRDEMRVNPNLNPSSRPFADGGEYRGGGQTGKGNNIGIYGSFRLEKDLRPFNQQKLPSFSILRSKLSIRELGRYSQI